MGLKRPLCLSWGHWRPCLLRRGGGVLVLCPQALGCGGVSTAQCRGLTLALPPGAVVCLWAILMS